MNLRRGVEMPQHDATNGYDLSHSYDTFVLRQRFC